MFPRLTSYSSTPSITANLTGVELGSRTFCGVQFSSLSLFYLDVAVLGTAGQLCRAGVTSTWLLGAVHTCRRGEGCKAEGTA